MGPAGVFHPSEATKSGNVGVALQGKITNMCPVFKASRLLDLDPPFLKKDGQTCKLQNLCSPALWQMHLWHFLIYLQNANNLTELLWTYNEWLFNCYYLPHTCSEIPESIIITTWLVCTICKYTRDAISTCCITKRAPLQKRLLASWFAKARQAAFCKCSLHFDLKAWAAL